MDYLTVTILAIVLVAVCVSIHYEVLRWLSALAHRPGRHRWLVLASMYGALVAHVLEIWVFGAGYWVADEFGLGTITSIEVPFDYLYYSAMVYTTVGFGDLIPTGAIRMLTSA